MEACVLKCPHECECSCHDKDVLAVHIRACCQLCQVCQRRIRSELLLMHEHLGDCHQKKN